MSLSKNKESIKGKKSLVIYFSRADENYAVGNIKKQYRSYCRIYKRWKSCISI